MEDSERGRFKRGLDRIHLEVTHVYNTSFSKKPRMSRNLIGSFGSWELTTYIVENSIFDISSGLERQQRFGNS